MNRQALAAVSALDGDHVRIQSHFDVPGRTDLDFKISQEVSRLAASAANDVMVARAHLNSLDASLGGTETTARSQNMARVQLQALESNGRELESRRKFTEAILESVPTGVLSVTSDGTIQRANRAARGLFTEDRVTAAGRPSAGAVDA